MGNYWWWRRFADLIDRRQPDGTYKKFDYDIANRHLNTRQKIKAMTLAKLGQQWERSEPQRAARTQGEKPPMVSRPDGMSRQNHRRLYREACKIAGVPYRHK